MVSSEPVLLIVAAEAAELAAIARRMKAVERAGLDVRWSRVGRLGGRRVLLAANGSGRRNAALAVGRARNGAPVEAVVSAGWCGGLDSALPLGAIVIADRVLALEPEVEFPACLPRWPGNAGLARGGVLTVDRFVATAEEKRRLRERGAIAVEMEAAAVAAEARRIGIPFYCVRAVSDVAEKTFHVDFNRARLPGGGFSPARAAAQAGLSLECWRELLQTWRDAGKAAESLGEFFASCRFEV